MLQPYLLSFAALLTTYLIGRLYYARYKQYADLPQLPTHLIWGHLKAIDDWTKRGIPNRHIDKVFEEMWTSLGRPPVMFLDLRPVTPPIVLITHHEMAEQITRPSNIYPLSTPKSPTLAHMIPIIGESSIIRKEGSNWKSLRKTYNPGFAPQYLWGLLPLILDKTEPFVKHLEQYAASGETFALEGLLSNLIIDIIGAAVMHVDIDAQNADSAGQGELGRLFSELMQTYTDDDTDLPWWAAPRRTLLRHRHARQIEALVKGIIRDKYREVKEDKDARSILALSLRDAGPLTPQLLTETADQIRSFLFAGHDTTSSTLEWVFYELSRTPAVLRALRSELDEVLGPATAPREVCAALLAHGSESVLSRLPTLNAVIKETMRLHPPASTVRRTPHGSGFTVRGPGGEDYCLDGLVMYPCQSILHRDRAVFGDDADEWVPQRWLGAGSAAELPASAWRPFERGPRNCIGQDLANLDMRAVVAIVARRYDFVKVGLGESVLDERGSPVLDDKGQQYKVKAELYNTRRMTARPVDQTMMKVRIATWGKVEQ